MTNSSLSLRSCTSMQDAYAQSELLYAEFKQKHQRNPLPDLNLSTISSPSIHSVDDRNRLITKQVKNDYNGAMSYKPFKPETFEVVMRWDNTDVKASKDALWFKERASQPAKSAVWQVYYCIWMKAQNSF